MRTRKRIGLGVLAVLALLVVILGAQSRQLHTEIEIAASATEVWGVLTDLGAYGDWNPHITAAEGTVAEGSPLSIRIDKSDGSNITFRPTVTKVVPNTELRWLGRLFLPRLFDGEHIFEITAVGADKVRFVQRETFRGLLVLPLWNMLNTETRHGFEAMNAALKLRAETADSNSP